VEKSNTRAATARESEGRKKFFVIRGIRRAKDVRRIMAIAVFIASILLSWEALSTLAPGMASSSVPPTLYGILM
jgi:hypothetical protein